MIDLARICEACQVKSLALKKCELEFEHFMQFAENANGARIDELSVSCSEFDANCIPYLVQVCEVCEVKSLNLEHCNLTFEHLRELAACSKNLKLEKLDVSSNRLIPMKPLAVICNASRLKSLKVQNCGLRSNHIMFFAETDENIKLDELDISDNSFAPNGMSYLARICEVSQMKVLKLGGCSLGPEHLQQFATNADMIKLDELDISNNSFAPNSMSHLARICEVSQMKILKLGDCSLGPEHLRQFATKADMIKLEELDVSNNTPTENYMKRLAAICEICQIKLLKLCHCGLVYEHLMQFTENARNTKIDVLDIGLNVDAFKTGEFTAVSKTFSHHLAKLCEVCEVKKLCVQGCNLQSSQLKELLNFARYTRIVEMDIDSNPNISEEDEIMLQKFLERNEKKIKADFDATAPVVDVSVKKSTEEFYESHQDDPLIYAIDRRREKRKVLIINNKFKDTRGERKGSEVDVKNLENLWRGLGFGVVTKHNLSADQMQHACREFSQGARNVSAVVIIIMTHGGSRGGEEFLQGEDGCIVYTANIIAMFNTRNSPHLQGIPKVFFLQVCRGGSCDLGPATDGTDTNHPLRSDMLIVYPSQSGSPAFRETTGSWLINAVTNIFMRHSHDTHVCDMLTRVNNAVSRKKTGCGNLQMCNQLTYLRKQLYFFP